MVLLFGADIPVIELLFAATIITLILMVEATVILVLLLYQLRHTRELLAMLGAPDRRKKK